MKPISIVLVHGAGGTPSTWAAVDELLIDRGFRTVRVTNPMTSLTDDVAHTTAQLADLDGSVLLAGHSYGGAVITNVGRAPGVVGLVYVAAFAPEEGETVSQIVERYPPAEVSKHMRRGPNGEWKSDQSEAYWAEIGWDLSAEQRRQVSEEHRQSADEIFSEPTGVPAWRRLPSWYLVAAEDKTLRPEIQRDMASRMGATTFEVPGSHFTPRTRAERVTELIITAVEEIQASEVRK